MNRKLVQEMKLETFYIAILLKMRHEGTLS